MAGLRELAHLAGSWLAAGRHRRPDPPVRVTLVLDGRARGGRSRPGRRSPARWVRSRPCSPTGDPPAVTGSPAGGTYRNDAPDPMVRRNDSRLAKGRRVKQLGDILLEGGLVSPTQLEAAYEEQQRVGRALGRVLVEQGVLTESQLVVRAGHPDRPALRRPRRLRRRRVRRRPRARGRLPPPLGDADRLRGRPARSSRWPTRRTSSPSTTSARSPAWRSSRSSRPAPTWPRPSTATTAPTPTLDDLTSVLDQRRGGGRPLQGQGDRRGRADRQVRQPAHHPGDPGPRVGHPPRADRDTTCGSGSASTACCTRCMRSPKAIQSGVISRLKIMADINIAERRIPQDGRLSVDAPRQEDRPARRDPADGVGREGRHADPGQLHGAARPGRPRLLATGNYERYSRELTPSRTG